jgi:hypothetical protein
VIPSTPDGHRINFEITHLLKDHALAARKAAAGKQQRRCVQAPVANRWRVVVQLHTFPLPPLRDCSLGANRPVSGPFLRADPLAHDWPCCLLGARRLLHDSPCSVGLPSPQRKSVRAIVQQNNLRAIVQQETQKSRKKKRQPASELLARRRAHSRTPLFPFAGRWGRGFFLNHARIAVQRASFGGEDAEITQFYPSVVVHSAGQPVLWI